MDKTTKFLLGLIAVGLIAINIQLYDGTNSVIKPAHAVGHSCIGEFNFPCYVYVKNWPSTLDVWCQNCN